MKTSVGSLDKPTENDLELHNVRVNRPYQTVLSRMANSTCSKYLVLALCSNGLWRCLRQLVGKGNDEQLISNVHHEWGAVKGQPFWVFPVPNLVPISHFTNEGTAIQRAEATSLRSYHQWGAELTLESSLLDFHLVLFSNINSFFLPSFTRSREGRFHEARRDYGPGWLHVMPDTQLTVISCSVVPAWLYSSLLPAHLLASSYCGSSRNNEGSSPGRSL